MDPHTLDELDEPSASLRIIVEISNNPQGVIVTNLYKIMKDSYDVGRTAVDTSRRALIKAEIITEYRNEFDRYNIKILALTPLGYAILPKITEMAELIEKSR